MKNILNTSFILYLLVNLLLLALTEFLILKLTGSPVWSWFWKFFLIDILVLCAQYPLLKRFKNWAVRTIVFIAGMIIGCFLSGVVLTLGSSGQLLTGGVVMASVGTLLGMLPCLLIVLINWLLEERLYSLKPEKVKPNQNQ